MCTDFHLFIRSFGHARNGTEARQKSSFAVIDTISSVGIGLAASNVVKRRRLRKRFRGSLEKSVAWRTNNDAVNSTDCSDLTSK